MKIALKILAVCGLPLAMLGGTLGSASAQTVCVEQPFLAGVDSNGDGIATAGEILAVAPDNAELQAVVGQIQAAGYSGIKYSGCDGSTGGAGSGTGTGGTGDGSGTGTGTGTGTTGSGDIQTGTGTGTTGSGDIQSGAGSGTTANVGATGGTGTDGTGQAGGGTVPGSDGESVVLLPSTGQGGPVDTSQPLLAAGMAALGVLSLLLALWSRTWRKA